MKILNEELEIKDLFDPSIKGEICDTFILTRFNLKMWKINKFGGDTRTREWTTHRFSLFENYCFPSIMNQTNKNFIWMCMFADDTDSFFIEKIKWYKKRLPLFYPVFINDDETKDLKGTIDSFIRKFKTRSSILLTSRIDNDDAVNVKYIEMAHQLSKDQLVDDCIYSLEKGLQYYNIKKCAFGIKYTDNHYLFLKSLHYNQDDIHDVLTFDHSKIKSFKYPFKLIKNLDYMWVELVHDSNVANDVKLTLNQKPIINKMIMKELFGWDIELADGAIISYFTFMLPRLFNLIWLKIRKKILRRNYY